MWVKIPHCGPSAGQEIRAGHDGWLHTHSPLHIHRGSRFPHPLVLFWSFLLTQLFFQAGLQVSLSLQSSQGTDLTLANTGPPPLAQSVTYKCSAMLAK